MKKAIIYHTHTHTHTHTHIYAITVGMESYTGVLVIVLHYFKENNINKNRTMFHVLYHTILHVRKLAKLKIPQCLRWSRSHSVCGGQNHTVSVVVKITQCLWWSKSHSVCGGQNHIRMYLLLCTTYIPILQLNLVICTRSRCNLIMAVAQQGQSIVSRSM